MSLLANCFLQLVIPLHIRQLIEELLKFSDQWGYLEL